MPIYQGEIVEVNFFLPEGKFKPHPVIVVSNNDINQNENAFIGVMLSSSAKYDDYSFALSDEMLSKKPKKQGQVRCQLLSLIPESEIIGRHGYIKKLYLNLLLQKICTTVFKNED